MKEVGIKAFQRHMYRYLHEAKDLCITSDKNPIFEVRFLVATKPIVATLNTSLEVATVVKQSRLVYGCGCERSVGERICSKHQRV